MHTEPHPDPHPPAVKSFRREVSSVPVARRWATDACAAAGASAELLDVCALLVSEVVANAVLHGAGDEYTVEVYADLSLTVRDASPAPPRRRLAGAEAIGGRGLELLEALAPGYEVWPDAATGGKAVRFTPKPW